MQKMSSATGVLAFAAEAPGAKPNKFVISFFLVLGVVFTLFTLWVGYDIVSSHFRG